MTCQQTRDLLHGYIDGELDLVRNVEIERHFNHCQNCAQTRQQQLDLRIQIQNGAPYFQPPELLLQRIRKSVREAQKQESPTHRSSSSWLAVAASIAILLFSGFWIWRNDSQGVRTNDLLALT
jgi:predicted anti-sigma-YlaC factor YlaD